MSATEALRKFVADAILVLDVVDARVASGQHLDPTQFSQARTVFGRTPKAALNLLASLKSSAADSPSSNA